jgi:Flp pilus assembly protein TadG
MWRGKGPVGGDRQPVRRGAALVEFAIVLALLLTIVLGCIDVGRYAGTSMVVANAAREGAFSAVMTPPSVANQARWQQNIQDAVRGEMATVARFDSSLLQVEIVQTTEPDEERSRVRVEVSYPFQTVVPWVGLPHELTLRRAVEMRVIR